MFWPFRRPFEHWKWLQCDHDLSTLPARVRQQPSRFEAAVVLCACALIAAIVPGFGYLAVTQDGVSPFWYSAFMWPFLVVGIAGVWIASLQFRSGRRVTFERDAVAVDGTWFRHREDWREPYSAFRGVGWFAKPLSTMQNSRYYRVIQLEHPDPYRSVPLLSEHRRFPPENDDDLAIRAREYADALGVPLLD